MESSELTMKFPYGISDFDSLITRQLYYVDRTDQIPLLEDAGDQLLFLRPRRFGKSLLLPMLDSVVIRYWPIISSVEFVPPRQMNRYFLHNVPQFPATA